MPKLMGVTFSLEGAIREDKETESFVAYCPALDLYSAGRTRPEAKKALQSAVDMYVRLCYDRGILGRLLHEKGFNAAVSGVGTSAALGTPGITEHPGEHGDFIAITESAHSAEYDDVFPVQVPIHLIANQQAVHAGTACPQ